MTTMEVRLVRNGVVCKKVCFYEQGKDFVVYEQERIEDLSTGQYRWETVFILPFPNKAYARTSFIGRLAQVAYEEGNPTDMEYEQKVKEITKSLASPLGKQI